MMPTPPPVVSCHACSACYWLEDASEIGQVSLWRFDDDVDPAWKAAPTVEEPTEPEYYRAIQSGLASTPDTERTLRLLAWWRHNDSFRDQAVSESPAMSDDCVANLEALLPLLADRDESAQIMTGEIHRELGNFHEAIKALNLVPMEYARVVGQIYEKAAAGERGLLMLSLEF